MSRVARRVPRLSLRPRALRGGRRRGQPRLRFRRGAFPRLRRRLARRQRLLRLRDGVFARRDFGERAFRDPRLLRGREPRRVRLRDARLELGAASLQLRARRRRRLRRLGRAGFLRLGDGARLQRLGFHTISLFQSIVRRFRRGIRRRARARGFVAFGARRRQRLVPRARRRLVLQRARALGGGARGVQCRLRARRLLDERGSVGVQSGFEFGRRLSRRFAFLLQQGFSFFEVTRERFRMSRSLGSARFQKNRLRLDALARFLFARRECLDSLFKFGFSCRELR